MGRSVGSVCAGVVVAWDLVQICELRLGIIVKYVRLFRACRFPGALLVRALIYRRVQGGIWFGSGRASELYGG